MDMLKLKNDIKKIQMTDSMKKRIVQKCLTNGKKKITVRYKVLPIAACMALVVCLAGFTYAAYTYWGAGTTASLDISDFTRPFGTVASDEEILEGDNNLAKETVEIIKNYDDVYADYFAYFNLDDSSIPSIYFSPNHMVILTGSESQGINLSAGEDVSFSFSLDGNQELTLELGYILNGIYHELSTMFGSDFSYAFTAQEVGEYYFCITNHSSSNAVISSGSIG